MILDVFLRTGNTLGEALGCSSSEKKCAGFKSSAFTTLETPLTSIFYSCSDICSIILWGPVYGFSNNFLIGRLFRNTWEHVYNFLKKNARDLYLWATGTGLTFFMCSQNSSRNICEFSAKSTGWQNSPEMRRVVTYKYSTDDPPVSRQTIVRSPSMTVDNCRSQLRLLWHIRAFLIR